MSSLAERTTSEKSRRSKKLDSPQSSEQEVTTSANHTSQSTAFNLSLASPGGWRNKQLLEQVDPGADSSGPLSTPRNSLSTSSSLKVLHSEGTILRIGSSRSVHSSGRDSIKTSSTRSFCSISHLNSVLSPSLSLRSSLGYTTSLSSKHQSSGSSIPWTSDELNSWKQLVDESAFPQRITRPEDEPEKSLQDRPCCNFFKESRPTWRATSFCNTCGFSEMHWRARFSKVADTAWMDPTSLDHFRNTPLHHAAAAGNTAQVLNLMSSLVRPSSTNSQRNTSGETFLHVFRLKGPEQFSAYEEVLEKASSQGFPFDAVDYQGQRISQILEDLLDDWSICPTQLTKVARTLGIEDIPQCHDGKLKPRGLNESWYEYEDSRKASETKLISTLKSWDNEKDSEVCLKSLIRVSDIHIRDKRGYTALALASGNGVHEAVTLLLEAGANPNTRSYHKTSVMEYAERHLRQAQKKGQNGLYAQILSCMALLSDHGGKANVSVHDEYGMIHESPKYRVTSSRSRQSSASSMTRKSAIRGRPRRQLESIVEPSHQPQELGHKTTPSSKFKDEEIFKTAVLPEVETSEEHPWAMPSESPTPERADVAAVPERSDFDTIFQECFSYANGFNHTQANERDNEEESALLLTPSLPLTIGNPVRPSGNDQELRLDQGCSAELEIGGEYAKDPHKQRDCCAFQPRTHDLYVQEHTETHMGTASRLLLSESEVTGTRPLSIKNHHNSWNFEYGHSPIIPPDGNASSTLSSHGTPNLSDAAHELDWFLPQPTVRPPPLPPRNIKPALPPWEKRPHEAGIQHSDTQDIRSGDNLYSFQENTGSTTGITPQILDLTFAPYDPAKAIPIDDTVEKAHQLSFDQAYQWYGMAGVSTHSTITGNDKIPRAQQASPLNSLSKQVSMETSVTPSGLESMSSQNTSFPMVDNFERKALNPAKRRRTGPRSDMLEVLLDMGWGR